MEANGVIAKKWGNECGSIIATSSCYSSLILLSKIAAKTLELKGSAA